MRRTGKGTKRTSSDAAFFRQAIFRWSATHGRAHLPWRRTRDPWKVLVSELMLQQTQVGRVISKYDGFIKRWPTPQALARAPLSEVLKAWSGLGYNRRAKFLHAAAKAIVARHRGTMPRTTTGLEGLPGIGRYTSRAVASFAFDADVALWDTNVRRIFLRFFHGGEFAARLPDDATLEAALERLLPRGRSRDWHGALMDFGSAVCTSRAPACASCPLRARCLAAPRFLAGRTPRIRLNRPQAKFEGSRRQARGTVLRLLARLGSSTATGLRKALARPDADDILFNLLKEGMVVRTGDRFALP